MTCENREAYDSTPHSRTEDSTLQVYTSLSLHVVVGDVLHIVESIILAHKHGVESILAH